MGAADMAQFLEVWIHVLALPTVVPPSRTHILFALLFVSSGQLLRGIVSPAFTSVVIYPHPCGDVEVVREEKHLRTESDMSRDQGTGQGYAGFYTGGPPSSSDRRVRGGPVFSGWSVCLLWFLLWLDRVRYSSLGQVSATEYLLERVSD